MKWFKKGTIALCLICTAAMWHTDTASAQTLNGSKTYTVDLNGDGKKENIKWVGKQNGDKFSVKVYVNGKKLTTASSDYGINAQVSIVDIDKTDKNKDIYVEITSESDGFEKGFGYQYQKKGLKKTFSLDQPAAGRLSILEKQPGDGYVWFSSEYSDSYFMQGTVKQAYKITSGKLKPLDKTVMNTTSEWKEMDYRSTRPIKVYTHIGDQKSAFTLSKNTIFHIYKIKTADYKHLYKGVTYIYIKTDGGKAGWIKNPKKEIFQGRSGDDWSSSAYLWG